MTTVQHVHRTLSQHKKDIEKMTTTAHSTPLLTSSIYNVPLLSTQSNLDNVLSYLNSRGAELNSFDFGTGESDLKQRLAKELPNIGVIDIVGSLTSTNSPINAMCGLTSYRQIENEMQAIADKGTQKTVVLNVSSGGGHAAKCFSTANKIKQIAKDNGIKLISYIDGISASAAYAMTVISDEIIAEPSTSTVGSIGVITAISDLSAQRERDLEATLYVQSSNNKTPYSDKYGAFKPEFIQGLQDDVNYLYGEFVTHVNKHRPSLSTSFIKSTEANTYRADIALQNKLVDKLMLEDDFVKYLTKTSTVAPQLTLEQAQASYKETLAKANMHAITEPTQDKLDAEEEAEEKQRIANLASFVKAQKSPKKMKKLSDYIAPVKADVESAEEELEIDYDAEREARLKAFLTKNK